MPSWLKSLHRPRTRPPGLHARDWTASLLRPLLLCSLVIAHCSLATPRASAATPAGTIINNRAEVQVPTRSGSTLRFTSNLASIAVAASQPPTSASAGFFRPDPQGINVGPLPATQFQNTNGTFENATDIPDALNTFALAQTCFTASTHFLPGELTALRIADADQNLDTTTVDSVVVEVRSTNGTESELVRLFETGPNTGVFSGFVMLQNSPVVARDGRISASPGSTLTLRYTDPDDPTDTFSTDMLVDPFGVVFNSLTGEPIDGVTVTILDDATGLPAEVFGNDGVSRYPSTVITGQTVTDASGATYEVSPGNYVFPLVRPGRYRYRLALGENAGFTFPSTAPPAQLNQLPGAPYALGPASTGGAFDVILVPVKVDLPVDPSGNTLSLTLSTPVPSAGTGDFVRYDLEVSSRRTLLPFRDVVITDQLPPGFRLETKSVRLDGARASVQPAADGRSFSLTVPTLASGETVRISYLARVTTARPGIAINAASASAGRIQSAPASASVLVKDDLMGTRAHILGRVARWENGRPTGDGLPGVAVFIETGAMSVTDARGFFRFEGLLPGTHVVQLDTTTLPAGSRAVLPRDTTENAGRPWSRFADVAAGSLWTADFFVEGAAPTASAAESAASPAAPTAALPRNGGFPAAAPTPAPAPAAPTYNQAWIDTAPEGYEWLAPTAATPLPTPAVKILVKHVPAHKITAFLNGEPVPGINFEGTMRSNHRSVAATLWRGVVLQDGENLLEIVRTDSFGIERGRERRVIRYAMPPVRAELVPTASTLIADGRTAPVIAVRLFDRLDQPARAGITGRFAIHEPYAAFREEKSNLALQPAAVSADTQFTVGDDGIALIKLQATAQSGTVRLDLALAPGTQELRADLRDQRQEWLVVGLAEGTAGWRTVNGHLENASADDLKDGTSTDGRVAFFAKGRIRGNWLLTAAYDSAKEKRAASEALHNGIDPDAYYTVYGDESERLENAPSSRKLYVKLERGAVAALFGDFSLDWTASSFTTYARELHGAKIDYRGEKLRASAFQSDAGLTHVRDEFRGSGLSGPYVLRYRRLVAFSERIVLQERDRLRPDRVLKETALTRNVDYTIDAIGGIVRLSEPLFPSSPGLNYNYLVVDYELSDQTAGVVQGARVEYTPVERVTVGASHIRQEHNGQTASLSGVDARVQLTKQLALTGEAARSDNLQGGSNAYRTELLHGTEKTDTRVYFREVGPAFGLGQLNAVQLGNRQLGLEASQQLTSKLTARELIYQETILGTGDQRQAGEAQLEWTRDDWSFRAGARSARDTRGDDIQQSHLLTSGISRRLFNDRLELRADREQSIAGQAENLDFPTRTVLGATFALTAKTSLIAEQEWTEAKDRRTAVTRLGAKSTPWSGGTLTGSVAQAGGPQSSTTVGSGLKQTVTLTPKLSVEGGFERTQLLSGSAESTNAGGAQSAFSSSAPLHGASGYSSAAAGESTSVFGGVHWKPGNILYNTRLEYSDAAGTRRTGALASAQTEAGRDLGLLGSLLAYQQTRHTSDAALTLDARLGAAWRPSNGSTIILQRLDFIHVPGGGSDLSESAASGWKVIENLHLNQRLGSRWQLSAHLGAKYVLAGYDRTTASSFTTLGALEARVNLTPKWDLGVHGATLNAWGAHAQRWSSGLSIGRTVAKNMWVSVGYNFTGFTDTDFTAARYTSPGVFVRFRLKFDQESLAGLLNVIKAE